MERSTLSADKQRGITKLETLSIGLALVSLLVAGTSAVYTYRLWSDRQRFTVVEDVYETFEEWNAKFLESPHLVHLAAPADRYDEVALRVEEAARELDREELLRLALTETVMADIIFDAYEELVFDLAQAEDYGDRLRIEIIGGALEVHESGLLRNPRMRYLWLEAGQDYRPESVLYRYRQNVADRSKNGAIDQVGPIGRALLQRDREDSTSKAN